MYSFFMDDITALQHTDLYVWEPTQMSMHRTPFYTKPHELSAASLLVYPTCIAQLLHRLFRLFEGGTVHIGTGMVCGEYVMEEGK